LTVYVFSTLTGGHDYTIYDPNPEGVNNVIRTIRVKGGANLADRRTLLTPTGVATKLTDDEYEALQQSPVFQRHLKRGFIHVSQVEADPERVAADMETRDESSPITPADFIEPKKDQARLYQPRN
jgi:hypothetical protein